MYHSIGLCVTTLFHLVNPLCPNRTNSYCIAKISILSILVSSVLKHSHQCFFLFVCFFIYFFVLLTPIAYIKLFVMPNFKIWMKNVFYIWKCFQQYITKLKLCLSVPLTNDFIYASPPGVTGEVYCFPRRQLIFSFGRRVIYHLKGL